MANDSRTRHLSYDFEPRNSTNNNNSSSMLRISQWLDNHQGSFGTVRKNPKYSRYKDTEEGKCTKRKKRKNQRVVSCLT